jgi:pyruvate/2-oxoglutarate dehydrogenase complex dihydrolipoamide dehydrogenase (E3) component
VAEKAARYGRHVAVVEPAKMGGTCVNNDCVPKKVMWYAAHLAHAVDHAGGFGIPTQRGTTDWNKLVKGRQGYIDNINRYWDGYVQDLGITHLQGRARFIGPGEIEVDGFDSVIWAVGRAPNTMQLNLQAAGVDLSSNGIVPTDEFQNTNVPGIYAIGDITGRTPLTPVAIAAGRRLADRLFNDQPLSRVDYEDVPSVVFSHPPVATVGLTEPRARKRHDKITVYKTEFTPMRYAL